jgi:hypothetical protein
MDPITGLITVLTRMFKRQFMEITGEKRCRALCELFRQDQDPILRQQIHPQHRSNRIEIGTLFG